MTGLENLIGYTFKDRRLLARALLSKNKAVSLTELRKHSLTPEEAEELREGYEELEFLGDRVLNLLIAEKLMERRELNLEEKAQAFNFLRSDEFLKEAGRFLKEFIIAHPSQKEDCIPDVLEALFGAVYLDGGMKVEKVRKIFEEFVMPFVNVVLQRKDYLLLHAKGKLHEYAMKNKLPPPEYEVLESSGDPQNPYFRIRCRFGELVAEGEGKTKKQAQAWASLEILRELGEV